MILFKNCIIYLCKFIIIILENMLNKGSSFPGKLAIKLDNDILKILSKKYKVILVTGTNGKTSTTSLIYNILKKDKFDVITNNTGANLPSGIATCFIKNYKLINPKTQRWAVLEVDEKYMPVLAENLQPNYILVTNLFRDQIDRNQEYYSVFNKICESFSKNKDAKLILNGDCSIFGNLNIENYVSYYGFSKDLGFIEEFKDSADFQFCKFCKTKYKYESLTYNCLGSFYCDNCGYKREDLKYTCNHFIYSDDVYKVDFNGDIFTLSQKGIFNIYNALSAYAIAMEIGIDKCVVEKSLNQDNSVFGRNQSIKIENKDVSMILVKNPTSFNQNIKMICQEKGIFDCCFIVNDNSADSTDVSWLWDVDFEIMKNTDVKNIYTSGSRCYDIAIRLKVAFENDREIISENGLERLLQNIIESPSKKIYVLSTYTAMFEFRKLIISKGYLKNMWS